MTEPDLERLIGEWYQRDSLGGAELRLTPSADCPPLTRLWQHHAEEQPLGEYEEHVERCDRCRRLGGMMVRERGRSVVAVGARGRGRRWQYVAGPALAAAACVAFLFVGWPQRDLAADVAAFAERAYAPIGVSSMRGGESEATSEGDEADPAWLAGVLTDPVVIDATDTQEDEAGDLLLEIGWNRIRVDRDGRLTISPNVDDPTLRAELAAMIDRDTRATEQIVDVLLRYLPGASEKDRLAVRRAIARSRAKNVFGQAIGEDE